VKASLDWAGQTIIMTTTRPLLCLLIQERQAWGACACTPTPLP
jgi:hypothetical protein